MTEPKPTTIDPEIYPASAHDEAHSPEGDAELQARFDRFGPDVSRPASVSAGDEHALHVDRDRQMLVDTSLSRVDHKRASRLGSSSLAPVITHGPVRIR